MKSFLKGLPVGLILAAIVWFAAWHYYGITEINATFDGSKIDGAPVYIDGKKVGQTPYKTRLNPGFYTIEVRPPQDYESSTIAQTWYFFTLALGMEFVAKFETPEIYPVPEDELVLR